MALAYDDYDDYGGHHGNCVLLIHGHPFDRTLWDPQAAALRRSFRVLVPDLRGFGRSPVTPGRVTMREFAADIEELLDGLGIARAAVVGLSMGGLVAMDRGDVTVAGAPGQRLDTGPTVLVSRYELLLRPD